MDGRELRSVNDSRGEMGSSLSPQAVFAVVAEYGALPPAASSPTICAAPAPNSAAPAAGNWRRFSCCWATRVSIQKTERYLGVKQDLVHAPNDRIGVRWHG